MGHTVLKRLFVMAALLWPMMATAQMSLPVYGNWCGPDHPVNPSRAGPPVNALDAACMRHDYCTAVQGRFNCGCDLTMMYELRNTPWDNPFLQSDARGIYDAIAVIPCTDPLGTAQKQSLFMQDALADVLNGNAAPMDIMERWRQMLIRGVN